MKDVPLEDLKDRLTSVMYKLDEELKTLGKQLEKVGELRVEAAEIGNELKRRGALTENVVDQPQGTKA